MKIRKSFGKNWCPFSYRRFFWKICTLRAKGVKKVAFLQVGRFAPSLPHLPQLDRVVLLHTGWIVQRHNSGTVYGLESLKKPSRTERIEVRGRKQLAGKSNSAQRKRSLKKPRKKFSQSNMFDLLNRPIRPIFKKSKNIKSSCSPDLESGWDYFYISKSLINTELTQSARDCGIRSLNYVLICLFFNFSVSKTFNGRFLFW